MRYALLVVLGYSRLLWCRFYPRQDMATLIDAMAFVRAEFLPEIPEICFPLAAIMVEADNQTDEDAKAPTVRADIRGNTVPSTPVFDFFHAQIGLLRVRGGERARYGSAGRQPSGKRNGHAATAEYNAGTAEASALPSSLARSRHRHRPSAHSGSAVHSRGRILLICNVEEIAACGLRK